MKANFLSAAMLISLLLSGCASRPPLRTVDSVDLGRYTGKWYEIAKYPNWFQRNCSGNTTAEYAARPGGSIGVVNQCLGRNGKLMRVVGTAKVVPGSGNAKLKVNFGGPISGAYWVIALDEKNYKWAVVGHPSRRYLWVLSRDPVLPDATYKKILGLIAASEYDVSRVELTPQQ